VVRSSAASDVYKRQVLAELSPIWAMARFTSLAVSV
jgi:hypothetical protein